jgi:hypothetical protein
MSMDNNPAHKPSDQPVPRRLIEGLRAEARRHQVLVPERIDTLIRQRAKAHLENGSRARIPKLPIRWTGRLWRVAAVLCLGGLLSLLVIRREHQTFDVTQVDQDQNGRINIVDVFALARSLHRQQKPTSEFDYNLDGIVDAQDVEILAARVVAVGKEEN